MSSYSCNHETPHPTDIQNLGRYRRVLWIALIVNAAMFFIEIAGSYGSASLALLADAIDFGGDALNYGVSLAVLSSALAWRARAAVLKAFCMMGFGLFVLGSALFAVWNGRVPNAAVMGGVAVLALIANVAVAWMLYAFREGDANMRSVWQRGRDVRGIGRFRHRLRMARSRRRQPDGGTRTARRLERAAASARRTAIRGLARACSLMTRPSRARSPKLRHEPPLDSPAADLGGRAGRYVQRLVPRRSHGHDPLCAVLVPAHCHVPLGRHLGYRLLQRRSARGRLCAASGLGWGGFGGLPHAAGRGSHPQGLDSLHCGCLLC
jgi:hypothetical protein